MKKYIYLLFIIYCSISSISCKKNFLEVNNTQNLFRESYVKDLSSMQEYVNGTYVFLSMYLEEGMAAAYPELVADNLQPASASSSPYMIPHYNWVQVSDGNDIQNNVGSSKTASAMDPLWLTGYTIIRACNFVIEDVDKYRAENSVKADDIKGQALAIRAYVLFRLVNTFAQSYNYTQDASHPGVPYIITSDITKPYTRQTVAEVYTGMIADLTKAIQLSSTVVTDIRYMNRNAAQAILARVYLFKEDFTNAKLIATEVAGRVPLMTISGGYPNDIFKFKSPTQTETLFQLSPYMGLYYTLFLNYYLRASSKLFLASSDIAKDLKENVNDIRQAWVTDISGQWNVTKFPNNSAPEVSPAIPVPETAYYPAVIRSSEMFLTVAEAAAKTGDENTARTYLDAIRKRADPSISSITASGTELLDSIYKERRKELAFESLRMYDLQRWKQGVKRSNVLPGSPANLSYPNAKAIAPIPFAEVKLAGLTQNQDY